MRLSTENLIGKKFNKLTILEVHGSDCLCKCDCGNETKTLKKYAVKKGHIKSCGCLNHVPRDLSGKVFGKLTAIKNTGKIANDGTALWLTNCSCGATNVEKSAKDLTDSHKINYCGSCIEHKKKGIVFDLTGQKFGRFIVLKDDGYKWDRVAWLSQCVCGEIYRLCKYELEMACDKGDKCLCHGQLIGQKFGKLTPFELIPAGKGELYNCLCDCGNTVKVPAGRLRSFDKASCGCLKSTGELLVDDYLKLNKYFFKAQFRISECRFKKALPFDFCVLLDTKKYLIEYNGEQHYQEIKYRYGGKDGLLKRQHNDLIKLNYCKNNEIPLLVIPYWELKNISQLLDNYLPKSTVNNFNEIQRMAG